jgi:hypothetical protein
LFFRYWISSPCVLTSTGAFSASKVKADQASGAFGKVKIGGSWLRFDFYFFGAIENRKARNDLDAQNLKEESAK